MSRLPSEVAMPKPRTTLGALVVALFLLACTVPGGSDEVQPTPSVNVGLGDRASADPAPVPVPGKPTRQITATFGFTTPSKNIGCLVTSDSARCDIANKVWGAPAPPAPCDLAYGNGLAVAEGKATIVCAGDTVLGADQTLPYGEAVRVGDFVCGSESSGVRCRNEATGHGFTLSRQAYALF